MALVSIVHVGSSTWVAGAATTVSPTYPAGLAQNDVVVIALLSRESATAATTPASWALVGAAAIGSGAVGAGTGPTRLTFFSRVVPSGGLTGSQAVAVTSGTSTLACMKAYRAADANATWATSTPGFANVASGTTGLSGAPTVGAAGSVVTNEWLIGAIGTPDDLATAVTLSSVTLTGCTLDTVLRTPDATVITATGNDMSGIAFHARVIGGANTATTATVSYTLNSAETSGLGLFVLAADVSERPNTTISINNAQAIERRSRW